MIMYNFIILLIFLLIFRLPEIRSEANNFNYNITLQTARNGTSYVGYENDNVTLDFNLYYFSSISLNLTCEMDELKVANLINWTNIEVPATKGEFRSTTFQVSVLLKRLGGSNLKCGLIQLNGNSTSLKIAYKFIVKRIQTIAELVFRICVIILLIIITFVMGCGLDRSIILGYLKKPISPSIGFACQYVLMPLIAFGLAKVSSIDNAFGLGLLTIGCSPGGGASNIWSVLLNGELNLSMTMTFLSTIAALFMMPLWLFALGRFFIDPQTVKIPYGNIMINLLQIVLPVGLGMLFRYKFESKAIKIASIVKFFGLFFIIFVMTYGTYANLYIYKLMGDYIYLLPIGAGLPWLGFILGGFLAYITRRKFEQIITIALETGFQNIGIAILILKFSIPQPGGDLGATMPIIVAIFTPLPLYIIYIILIIYRKCCRKEDDKNNDDIEKNDEELNNLNDKNKSLLKDNKLEKGNQTDSNSEDSV